MLSLEVLVTWPMVSPCLLQPINMETGNDDSNPYPMQ